MCVCVCVCFVTSIFDGYVYMAHINAWSIRCLPSESNKGCRIYSSIKQSIPYGLRLCLVRTILLILNVMQHRLKRDLKNRVWPVQYQQRFQIILNKYGTMSVKIGKWAYVITNCAENPHALQEQPLGQAPIWHDGPLPDCQHRNR